MPVLATKAGRIIAGHGRVEAAKLLGLETVPVMIAEGWTEAQVRAYTLADNKLAENASWDQAVLSAELTELRDLGVSLELLGFDPDELHDLIAAPSTGVDPDEVPEPPVVPVSKTGDLWLMGKHRLLCGDSTKAEDVARLMDGAIPTVMVADQPYGVGLNQSWRDAALGTKAMGPGNKNLVENDDRSDWTDAWLLFTGDVAYVWHADKYSDLCMASLRNAGFEICQQLIWNKSIMIMGRSDYHFKHEPCWYAVRKGRSHHWSGDRKQTTVLDAASPNHIMGGSIEDKTEHPTQKPIACHLMFANHDGDVYDPFLGSGTTLIAAETTARACYALEIAPQYIDISVLRWQAFTGLDATLDGDGRTFEEIKLERQKSNPDAVEAREGQSRQARAAAV